MIDYPASPLTIEVQAFLLGDWRTLDASTGGTVRQSPPITITRGAQDEQTRAAPGVCRFTLNDAGHYLRRNPASQWYGSLGKNTPVRVHVPLLVDDQPQTVANGWGAPDGTDVWVNEPSAGGTVAATDWSRSGTELVHSVPATGAYRGSVLDGTGWIDGEVRFTVELPTANITGGLVHLVVPLRYLDISNYIGVQVRFTTSETVAVQVTEAVAGTDRILLAETVIDGLSVATDQIFAVAVLAEGQVIRVKVWAAGDPEPLDWQQTATQASVRAGRTGLISVVPAGNTNSLPFLFRYDGFRIVAVPFCGEITTMRPGSDDASNASRYVAVEAGDMLRRLQQGRPPARSAMARSWGSPTTWIREISSATATGGDVRTFTCADAAAVGVSVGALFRLHDGSPLFAEAKEDALFTVLAMSSSAGVTDIEFSPDARVPVQAGDVLVSYRRAEPDDMPIAYWPCEDETDATGIASGLEGGSPMQISYADPDFGSVSAFLGGGSVLRFNNAELTGFAPLDYDNSNEAFTITWLLSMPETNEPATGQDVLQFQTTGTGASWDLQYVDESGIGDIRVTVFDAAGAILHNDWYMLALKGEPSYLVFSVRQATPTTVEFTFEAVQEGRGYYNQWGELSPVTAAGVTTLGRITRLRANPGSGYFDVGFGHLAVTPKFLDSFPHMEAYGGYYGESLPRRLRRLAEEEGVPLVYCGSEVVSGQLAAQQPATPLAALTDPVDSMLGLLYGARGARGLEYRTNSDLYSQPAVLELDYAAGELHEEIVPVDDDQRTRNDVTVRRRDGSWARHVVTTGPMSVQDPPGGVGRYDDSVTIGIRRDRDLPYHAQWRTHLGTVDEYRYPGIGVSPATGRVPLARLFAVNVGSRLVITNAGGLGEYDPIAQLALGYTLTLHKYAPVWAFNTVPASPYEVFTLDTDLLDSGDTTLDEDLDTTETAVTVAVAGAVWDDTEAPFDVRVLPDGAGSGGERLTMTAVSGAASPQTFTTTRNATGLPGGAAHGTGASVVLADAKYLGL